MSWHFNYIGRRAAVRTAVQNAKGFTEADSLHIDNVRPTILALIDANTCDAMTVTASGHRDKTASTLAVSVASVSGYVG